MIKVGIKKYRFFFNLSLLLIVIGLFVLLFYSIFSHKSKLPNAYKNAYKLERIDRDFAFIQNWIAGEKKDKNLTVDDYSFIDIYSKNQSPYSLFFDVEKSKLILYSIGPDQNDNYGKIMYDPTNGLHSIGDIIIVIPTEE